MLIIGELINSSRKAIAHSIEARNADAIAQVASDQFEHGASYIDVNAGTFIDREAEYLRWLVTEVQKALQDAPCCIDSPNPKAIEAALVAHKGPAMINSISLEKHRYESFLPLVAGGDMKVVALCVSDEGMPKTADDRTAIADKLINALVQNNVPIENIYVDPLVQPIATNGDFGIEFLKSISNIMTAYPGIHTVCGLSNISYGLPERNFLNQAFMIMAIMMGLDGAILNPLDKKMMAAITAAEALVGRDDLCLRYLKAYRTKGFEF